GHFLTPEQIERQPGMSVGGLVRGLPGVIVRYIPREGYQVKMRRAGTYVAQGIEECTPTVYIDGTRSMLGMEYVEILFRSEEIAAIEVYSRAIQRPAEFRDMFDTCGAIAIWTKPFESKVKRR
ncbi:MAG: Plug domain-containing protein, partial [Gemmatimonadaceae bacterium]